MDALAPFERETGNPILPPEAEKHGDFDDAFIPDEGGQLTKTKRRRSTSSLARMADNGQITLDQLAAAFEIAAVAENIQRDASVRCASLEARVDSSGSARDALVERLHLVRMEQAYSLWRSRLPVRKRMVVDMVLAKLEGATISAPARAWLSASLASNVTESSLRISLSRTRPQCPWDVYSQRQTSVIRHRSGTSF